MSPAEETKTCPGPSKTRARTNAKPDISVNRRTIRYGLSLQCPVAVGKLRTVQKAMTGVSKNLLDEAT
jgi:hypothetical protein